MFKELVMNLTKEQIDELERLGVARPRVSEWRKGKGIPSRRAVLILAQVTGANPVNIEAEIMLMEAAPEQRDLFRRILSSAGATIAMLFLILQLASAPENALANQALSIDSAISAKYTSWKVNLVRLVKSARARVVRLVELVGSMLRPGQPIQAA